MPHTLDHRRSSLSHRAEQQTSKKKALRFQQILNSLQENGSIAVEDVNLMKG